MKEQMLISVSPIFEEISNEKPTSLMNFELSE